MSSTVKESYYVDVFRSDKGCKSACTDKNKIICIFKAYMWGQALKSTF